MDRATDVRDAPPGLIRPEHAAQILGIPQKELWNWAREGRITKVEQNGQEYFVEANLYQVLQPVQTPAPPIPGGTTTGDSTRQVLQAFEEARRYYELGIRYLTFGMAALHEAFVLGLPNQSGQQVSGLLDRGFGDLARQGLIQEVPTGRGL